MTSLPSPSWNLLSVLPRTRRHARSARPACPLPALTCGRRPAAGPAQPHPPGPGLLGPCVRAQSRAPLLAASGPAAARMPAIYPARQRRARPRPAPRSRGLPRGAAGERRRGPGLARALPALASGARMLVRSASPSPPSRSIPQSPRLRRPPRPRKPPFTPSPTWEALATPSPLRWRRVRPAADVCVHF